MPAASRLSVLVVSCSLNAASRSHRLACAARTALRALDVDAELIDLREWELPFCDGGGSYEHPSIAPLAGRIERAAAVLVASPVYNYDLNAAAKNLVEMTGAAWSEKPVGFLCTAGARSSFRSRSSRPPKGSRSSPVTVFLAIAFTVKSRRARSSSIELPNVTSGQRLPAV